VYEKADWPLSGYGKNLLGFFVIVSLLISAFTLSLINQHKMAKSAIHSLENYLDNLTLPSSFERQKMYSKWEQNRLFIGKVEEIDEQNNTFEIEFRGRKKQFTYEKYDKNLRPGTMVKVEYKEIAGRSDITMQSVEID
jgi:hypothetical protein